MSESEGERLRPLALGSCLAMMSDRVILELGSAADALTDPQQTYTKRLLHDTPRIPDSAADFEA